MSNWKIPLYKVLTNDQDVKAVSKVIKRGMNWALGEEIQNFEKLLAKYVGTKFAVTFNSGTSALHAALIAINIKSGNEIIVPSFTFISTVNACLMVNAIPRFNDIEENTLGLNPLTVDSNINRKTKAIIPIHYGGLPCKIEEILSIAKRKKIFLIEDAAESLGASINKKMIGTFGDLSIFSFAGNKVLTTGEGGAIVTNSNTLYEKLKLIRSHGRKDNKNYFSSIEKPNYISLGYNWRMSSITAALAISQLQRIEKLINLRRNNASFLSKKLQKFKEIQVPQEPKGYRHVFQLYSILVKNSVIRNNLMKHLAKKGIMSKVFFYPVHKTNFYKKSKLGQRKKLSVTENISNQILSLPMHPGLKREELNYICDTISEFMEDKKN